MSSRSPGADHPLRSMIRLAPAGCPHDRPGAVPGSADAAMAADGGGLILQNVVPMQRAGSPWSGGGVRRGPCCLARHVDVQPEAIPLSCNDLRNTCEGARGT